MGLSSRGCVVALSFLFRFSLGEGVAKEMCVVAGECDQTGLDRAQELELHRRQDGDHLPGPLRNFAGGDEDEIAVDAHPTTEHSGSFIPTLEGRGAQMVAAECLGNRDSGRDVPSNGAAGDCLVADECPPMERFRLVILGLPPVEGEEHLRVV